MADADAVMGEVKGLDEDIAGEDLTLQSQDGVTFTVKRKVALGSELIKTMTENGNNFYSFSHV
jgi:hypothetical protein